MKQFILSISFLCLYACQKQNTREIDLNYNPDINLSKFSNSIQVTNPFFGLLPGKTYYYEGNTGEGKERNETKRLSDTKIIQGIKCIIVEDKAYLNEKLIEYTLDWFAQDNEGNVWYFGEQVDNYDSKGNVKDHKGSWEAGVNGAKPGIIMLAKPQVGMKYRQEYLFNEAEDEGEVLSINENISLPNYPNLTGCIKTKDFTALEPQLLEHKFYAMGLGLVKTINVNDKEETILVSIK